MMETCLPLPAHRVHFTSSSLDKHEPLSSKKKMVVKVDSGRQASIILWATLHLLPLGRRKPLLSKGDKEVNAACWVMVADKLPPPPQLCKASGQLAICFFQRRRAPSSPARSWWWQIGMQQREKAGEAGDGISSIKVQAPA